MERALLHPLCYAAPPFERQIERLIRVWLGKKLLRDLGGAHLLL